MPLNRTIRLAGSVPLLTAMLSTAGLAGTDAADLCLQAAVKAARSSGVPVDVLLAVSVVETGRNDRPWPWTVNIGGEGYWLDSSQAAERLVEQALDEGRTNLDLGCFQLNYRWHAEAFASVPDMLDPEQNAAYAADFLAWHYAQTGDWAAAAAAYHSATPEYADRYRARFETAWATLGAGGGMLPPPQTMDRTNRFPLLIAGQTGIQGSLVPATSGTLRLIGGP
ncbi:MAG: lytic transglycosylase [Rhodobacter sp.]|nr:lytic transglycosylase [Rhodobacter sp.]